MADRYWVGGSGTWDASTTTNWSDTSGGSGGFSAPTSADNAYFDGASDTGAPFTVTIGTGAVCADVIIGDGSTVTVLDQTMTLAGSASWSIFGSLYFPATNLTRTYTGVITFAATTTGKTVTTNGVSLGSSSVFFSGVGGEWTLGSAATFSQWHITDGTFITANYNVTALRLGLAYTTARTLTLGSSTITLSDGANVLAVTNTNLTLNAGTSTMAFNAASPQPDFGVGTTWYNISYTNTGTAGTPRISGTFTCNNFTAANRSIRIDAINVNMTVNGDLSSGSGFEGTGTITCNGVARYTRTDLTRLYPSGNYNVLVIGGPGATGVKVLDIGANQTITGALHVQSGFGATFDITDTAGAITAATVNAGGEGYNVGDVLNVTGGNGDAQLTVATLSGTAIATVTISTPGTGYTTATGVATTLYSSALNPNRRVVIRSNTLGTARTITAANVNITNADFRDITAAGAATWDDDPRVRFWGDAKGNTGITFSAADNMYRIGTGNWSATQWSDTSGGTPATQWFPLAQDTAIFDTGTTTGTHTLDASYQIGSFDSSALNVAVTLATGTTTPTFYGDVTLDADLTLSGTGAITFAERATQTITSAGRTFTQPLTVDSPSGTVVLADALTTNGAFTLTQGTLDLGNQTLTALTFSASNTNTRAVAFGTGKISLTGNAATVWSFATATGFTYTGTPLIESTYSGSTGTRTLTHGTTGGTETNAVSFNITAGTDTTAITGAIKSLNFTGFSGTLSNGARTIYDDLTVSTGMTLTAGASATTFAATSGTQQITSAGKSFDFPVTVNAPGASVQLVDDLTVGAGRTVTFTAGTLDLDGNTLSVDTFSSSNSNTRVIDFGTNGVLEVRGTGTAFNAATGTNLTTAGTGNISFVSGYTKTFAGGGRTYPTLSHNGSGILAITGANTFANINNTYDGLYNLLDYTEQFDNSVWDKSATTIAANTTTAPDSTSTADTLAETTANAQHFLFRNANVSITSGTTYTYSIYVKKGPGGSAPDIIQLAFSSTQFGSVYANFNLATGAWGTSSGVTTIAPVNAGSGWYRIAITATATATGAVSSAVGIFFTNNNDALGRAPSYAGNTAADLYVWGAQLVQGTAAIDYQRVAAPNDWATIAQVGTTTITFPASTITSVQDFNVNGTAGNLVTLNSSSPGTQWSIQKV